MRSVDVIELGVKAAPVREKCNIGAGVMALAAEVRATPTPDLGAMILALQTAGAALDALPAWRRRHDLAAAELARRVVEREAAAA